MEIGNLNPVMVCKGNVVRIPMDTFLRNTILNIKMTSTSTPYVHLVLAKTPIVFKKVNLVRPEGGSRIFHTATTDKVAKLFFLKTINQN